MLSTAGVGGSVDVEWHVALRDLDTELNLDADDDGRLTWGEVRPRWPALWEFVGAHWWSTPPCPVAATPRGATWMRRSTPLDRRLRSKHTPMGAMPCSGGPGWGVTMCCRAAVAVGSLAIAALATIWLVERAFDIPL